MLRPRKTIDAGANRAKLDDFMVAVQREAEGAESDPFDDAMVTAVVGIEEATKAEAGALADLEARLGRLARRV